MLTIAHTSLEHIKSKVTRDDGSDPTSDVVKMAFMAEGEVPDTGDFYDADWETIDGEYFIRCLVGPGGEVTLTAGVYVVWVKITDNPEIPIHSVGYMEVI